MKGKKATLKKCGRKLFSSKGFKDTKVAEITDMAGMATGSFYRYYKSKDHLFIEIFLEENVKLKKKITDQVDLNSDPMTIIKQMMFLNQKGMSENPILNEWYNTEIFSKIEQKYRKEEGIEQMDFLYDQFVDIVKDWQDNKIMRNDIDTEMIMAIFSAIINIDTHKDEIGIQYFPQVLEYLVEFVIKGLMDT
ncbi:MAG: TetR family transcriptional regulator [Candidatus Lokiarchaeota archaeon]|nr:TetR family transcriptional regulator [Candidatus Lokiarchaeota archaeon]MBD3199661.1 TetR family transcriptional regulator [Candidatus Lokiarchaeota archaeon]